MVSLPYCDAAASHLGASSVGRCSAGCESESPGRWITVRWWDALECGRRRSTERKSFILRNRGSFPHLKSPHDGLGRDVCEAHVALSVRAIQIDLVIENHGVLFLNLKIPAGMATWWCRQFWAQSSGPGPPSCCCPGKAWPREWCCRTFLADWGRHCRSSPSRFPPHSTSSCRAASPRIRRSPSYC